MDISMKKMLRPWYTLEYKLEALRLIGAEQSTEAATLGACRSDVAQLDQNAA